MPTDLHMNSDRSDTHEESNSPNAPRGGVVPHLAQDIDPQETAEWLESLDYVIETAGPERAAFLLERLKEQAFRRGVRFVSSATTPYVNTIPADQQPEYPGDREIERQIKSIIRWNAMAMVVRANRESHGHRRAHLDLRLGRHALRSGLQPLLPRQAGRAAARPGLLPGPRLAGHLRPGVPGRAAHRGAAGELPPRAGPRRRAVVLSAPLADARLLGVPHGVDGPGPDHGHLPGPVQPLPGRPRASSPTRPASRVWAFLGDGECDEPETLGAITLAAREQLDNLIFVVNCNLQRLDGPVRGNGKIIQELEGAFRGAGWNVIKVIWGSDWDPLLAKDADGLLVRRMGEVVDGAVPEVHRHARRLHPRALLRRRPAAGGAGRPT